MKSSALVRKLGIRKTADPQVERGYTPATKGVQTGLGICLFWATLFEANEQLVKARRMTDEEIKRQVLEEFPPDQQTTRTKKALLKLGAVGEKGSVTVNYHRNCYNKGRYTGGNEPKLQSKRYGPTGDVVNGRTGKSFRS